MGTTEDGVVTAIREAMRQHPKGPLSMRQLAQMAGVQPMTVSDILSGKRHPSDVTMAKLERALGVSLDAGAVSDPAPIVATVDEAPVVEADAGAGKVSIEVAALGVHVSSTFRTVEERDAFVERTLRTLGLDGGDSDDGGTTAVRVSR